MRKRLNQRIFKRFMDGESLDAMWLEKYERSNFIPMSEFEQAIRECVNEIKKGEK